MSRLAGCTSMRRARAVLLAAGENRDALEDVVVGEEEAPSNERRRTVLLARRRSRLLEHGMRGIEFARLMLGEHAGSVLAPSRRSPPSILHAGEHAHEGGLAAPFGRRPDLVAALDAQIEPVEDGESP